MKWNVGFKIGAGFTLALTLMAVIGTVSYRNTVQLVDTAAWVSHTHEVLESLESVLSHLRDAETGQRGFLVTGAERYLEPYTDAHKLTDEEIDRLRTLTRDNPNQQQRISRLEPLVVQKFEELQETIDARGDATRGLEVARKIVLTDLGKNVMDEMREIIRRMTEEEAALLAERSEAAKASADRTKSVIVLGILAAGVLLAMVGVVITRNIVRPLRSLTILAERISQGDLRGGAEIIDRQDEVGQLSRTFGLMRQNLRQLTADMVEGVGVLGSAATEITATTSQLASSSSESAAAVSQTSTTVEEVRQTTRVSSEKAQSVSDRAEEVERISISGLDSTEDVQKGMERINHQMEAIAVSMTKLSEQSAAVGQIMATVEDLASQSNLLAVNAAIEAAKAGESGKGFSVVAQEVKSLAEQSRQATDRVRTILSDIQQATATAVLSVEQGSKTVSTGSEQARLAGESIQNLSENVTAALQAARQIAASSQQQLVGVDQVASAMENIKLATNQNGASARQLEAAARNLNELGQRLQVLVSRYRLDQTVSS